MSLATLLEAFLFFDGLAIRSVSIPEKVNDSRPPQNDRLVGILMQLVTRDWNNMANASRLCTISQFASEYVWRTNVKDLFFVAKRVMGLCTGTRESHQCMRSYLFKDLKV